MGRKMSRVKFLHSPDHLDADLRKLEILRFVVLFAYRMGLFDRDLFWFLWEACSYEQVGGKSTSHR